MMSGSLQQTLRLQELADLHHGAMKTAHAVTLPQVRDGQITACGLQWCFSREKRVTPVIRIAGQLLSMRTGDIRR
jgi:hypothetical protein